MAGPSMCPIESQIVVRVHGCAVCLGDGEENPRLDGTLLADRLFLRGREECVPCLSYLGMKVLASIVEITSRRR